VSDAICELSLLYFVSTGHNLGETVSVCQATTFGAVAWQIFFVATNEKVATIEGNETQNG
jgi:hypothetical protein